MWPSWLVEIFTPKPDETLWFFKDLLALEESERYGQSVYLRAYEDSYHRTLKVTEASEAGMGHCAWRTSSPQALERRVRALEASGAGGGWTDGDKGHGPAYRFETPDGHEMEILWEVDYAQIPEEERPDQPPPEAAPEGRAGTQAGPREPARLRRHDEQEVHAGEPGLPAAREHRPRRGRRGGSLTQRKPASARGSPYG